MFSTKQLKTGATGVYGIDSRPRPRDVTVFCDRASPTRVRAG